MTHVSLYEGTRIRVLAGWRNRAVSFKAVAFACRMSRDLKPQQLSPAVAQDQKREQSLIFGEAHLRRILSLYAIYYNVSRTHLSLHKDAPLHRAIQRSGTFVAVLVLGGLHHRYARI